MPKRKTSDYAVDEENDDIVPIPIQFFFWNQTSLFIKQKFGTLTEAHAMNFERVLVQNILHGLSPGLSDAINSISRWAFIKASFPHILHACAATLVYRKDNSPGSKLGKTETKLLYTLHWLILDAASECEDNSVAAATKLIGKPSTTTTTTATNTNTATTNSTTTTTPTNPNQRSKKYITTNPALSSRQKRTQNYYLHSVATIQLFVYLFVPILKSLKPTDLDNLKLSNGLKIWEPLWAYRQPDIPIFNTPVKQKQSERETTEAKSSAEASIKKPQQQEQTKIIIESSPNTSLNLTRNDSKKLTKTTSIASPLITIRSALVASNNTTSNFGDIYMGGGKPAEENPSSQVAQQSSSSPSSSPNEPISTSKKTTTITGKSSAAFFHKSSSFLENYSNKDKLSSQKDEIERRASLKNQLSTTQSQSSSSDNVKSTESNIIATNNSNNIEMQSFSIRNSDKDEEDSIQISEIDSDVIRDSSTTLNKKVPTSAPMQPLRGLRAPIVHMSSICSFSDTSPQLSSPALERDVNNKLTDSNNNNKSSIITESISEVENVLFGTCPNCKVTYRNKNNGISRIQKVCQKCSTTLTFSSNTLLDLHDSSSESTSPVDKKQADDFLSSSITKPTIEHQKPNQTDSFFDIKTEDKTKTDQMKTSTSSTTKEPKQTEFKDLSNLRMATYFDVAVMRCLLSPKWHPEGYLWALEYLSYRVTEITDFTLKEQDRFFKYKSASIPSNIDEMCIQMGIDATDVDNENTNLFNFKSFSNKKMGYTNQFIDLINQIYIESDLTNPKYTFNNLFDYSKRKKYEANFHTRIRRIKYIDDDLQPKRFQIKQTNSRSNQKLGLPTTPFTFNELQSLNIENQTLKNRLKKDSNNFNFQSNIANIQYHEWPKDLEDKVNHMIKKLNNISKEHVSLFSKSQSNASIKGIKITNSNQILNRLISFSDTNINYQAYEDIEEASGSAGLINLDGSLNLNMILKGVHSVILKENSLKVCELALNILENLMNIDIMPSEEIDNKLEHAKTHFGLSQSSHAYLDELEAKYNENFHLATDLALRNIKWLGCINCQANSKSFLNDQLRGKIKLLLSRLHKKNSRRFKDFFKSFIQISDINHIMETFHALFGYCHDPLSGYGHYYPYITIRFSNHRTLQKGSIYANNFGNDKTKANQETTVNIESVIIELILKPLVKRLIDMKNEIMNQENLYLFSDIRNLLGYIKENHGGIFRKVAFSNMLEPLIKLKLESHQRNLKLKQIDEKLAELEKIREHLTKLNEAIAANSQSKISTISLPNTSKGSEQIILSTSDYSSSNNKTGVTILNEDFEEKTKTTTTITTQKQLTTDLDTAILPVVNPKDERRLSKIRTALSNSSQKFDSNLKVSKSGDKSGSSQGVSHKIDIWPIKHLTRNKHSGDDLLNQAHAGSRNRSSFCLIDGEINLNQLSHENQPTTSIGGRVYHLSETNASSSNFLSVIPTPMIDTDSQTKPSLLPNDSATGSRRSSTASMKQIFSRRFNIKELNLQSATAAAESKVNFGIDSETATIEGAGSKKFQFPIIGDLKKQDVQDDPNSGKEEGSHRQSHDDSTNYKNSNSRKSRLSFKASEFKLGPFRHHEKLRRKRFKSFILCQPMEAAHNLGIIKKPTNLTFKKNNEMEILQQVYDMTIQYRKKIQSERHFVDLNIVFKGIEYYRFLMECLPPAAIPDVPFMSALLELEAPVISKAAFLLETAYFVNRCNRKDWPEWIKMNIGSYRPYGSFASSKNIPNTIRRNKIYQLAAANMFLAWAEVLANKLESILDAQAQNKSLNSITKIDPLTGAEIELAAEDYYDEDLINPNGNNCPYALQNIVCILLLEITTFLRETYQYLPKKINSSNIGVNLRHENLHTQNTNSTTNPRSNRINIGSVFSNESSNMSIGGGASTAAVNDQTGTQIPNENEPASTTPKEKHYTSNKPETSKIQSNDNISMHVNPTNETAEHQKHISFAFLAEKEDDESFESNPNLNQCSTSLLPVNDLNDEKNFEISRLSTGAVIGRNGVASSLSSSLQHHDHHKSGSITQINQAQKRNSFKTNRRPSLKYRVDRSQRNTNFNSSNLRRKLSHGTSLSFHASEEKESDSVLYLGIANSNPATTIVASTEAGDGGFIVLTNPNESTVNGASVSQTFQSTNNNPTYVSSSSFHTGVESIAINDACEVDEIDFNRCFPWIKVVVRLLGSINYDCNHLNTGKKQRTNSDDYCSPDCYLNKFKTSHSLIEAVIRMYETSSNLRLLEKYEKEERAKEQNKKDGLLTKTYDKSKSSFSSTTKDRKTSQSSSSSQKIHYLNTLLKKNNIRNNLLPEPITKNISNHLIAERVKRDLKLTKREEKLPTIDFVSNQIQHLNQIPLLVLCKSILIMTDEYFIDLIKITWNLLLNSDQEIASSTATLFIIGSIKQPNFVEELLRNELKCSDVNLRFQALLKFEVLWKFRYHIWPRLESNAHNLLKISPPCIEFVLPSPPIGIPYLQPVDPPWMPKAKTKVEEVTINQEEVRAVVTASKSRKKHQQEIIHKALQADQLNKRIARENFCFTNLGFLQYASYEPFMHQTKEGQEEVVMFNEEHHEAPMAPQPPSARRQSMAPVKRLQQRNSFIWSRKSFLSEGNDEAFENINSNNSSNEIQQSQPVFPASISTAVFSLIDLLFDCELNSNNQSISGLANRIVWNCLIEDAALFLRYFFEKITQKDKKNVLIQHLRKLINAYVDLPPQTAYVIFNYLLGIVMYHVRSSSEGSQEAVSAITSLIWQIVSNVNGIVFKDLKQTLRKEQCDPSLLITANVPSAKKLIVHGPDLSQIPTQTIIFEDTQFSNVLQESLDFFSIPEIRRDKHFLFDVKTNQIHVPDTFVRNFYFFRRNFTPQLSLIQMDPKEAIKLLEKTAFNVKVSEQSKVLFFRKMLESTPFNQIYTSATFLHEELVKLPTFPRKSLEADFSLFPKLPDRELLTTDMLHKYSWCQLIWSLFSSMDCKTASTWDVTLFLNVINGSFILHCEDLIMIRTCLAIYINSAKHFQHIFATNGFLLIMPSLMKVYSNTQANPTLKNAIEFACIQFYIMHRIPFILQLFGSVAQILDLNSDTSNIIDTNKIQSSCLFNLLLSMENNVATDNLRILELVKTYNIGSGTASSGQSAAGAISSDNSCKSNTNISNLNTPGGAAGGLNETKLGASSAVLAVSGISATNLLITSSGALGINQITNLTSSASNNYNNQANVGGGNISSSGGNLVNTGTNLPTNIDNALNSPIVSMQASSKSNENYKNMIRALDFCYSDDPNSKFTIIDAVNLCVTVVAYAAHAHRANQMLVILDVIIPRYLQHFKSETDKIISNLKSSAFGYGSIMDKQSSSHYYQETTQQARSELATVQKISVAIRTLVNTSDFLTRTYTGPRAEVVNTTKVTNSNTNKNSVNNRSPSIMPDEDSMRFGEEKRTKKQDVIDEKLMKQEFRSPRDFLLNIVSEFAFFGSKRIKELYKLINDTSVKVTELLDTKAHCKLVEIAHVLLKLWDDSTTLNGNGLQNYFQKLIPVTDWTQEELKPAFNNLLRRVDRLFTKISKRPSTKKQLDWAAIAGVLNGLYMTLDKQESIANLPYFKLLINSTISLILNETSSDSPLGLLNSGSIFSSGSSSIKNEINFQIPIIFSKALIKLVGRYINALKDQSNLEQLFGSAGSNSIAPSMPSGLAYLINFLLPLLFWSASDRKDSPKLNANDISFVVSILLNALKPPSKLAATLLLQAPKQHHLLNAFDTSVPSMANNIYNKSAKQLKDIISQSTFLALKVVTFGFSKQIELTKIAQTIRQIFTKVKSIYLWKFIEFICTYRTPLYLLLKPFIENFVATQNCENDQELQTRSSILHKLNCTSSTNSKCNDAVLSELIDELNSIKTELQGYFLNSQKNQPTDAQKQSNFQRIPNSFRNATRRISVRLKKKLSAAVVSSASDASNNENSQQIDSAEPSEEFNSDTNNSNRKAFKLKDMSSVLANRRSSSLTGIPYENSLMLKTHSKSHDVEEPSDLFLTIKNPLFVLKDNEKRSTSIDDTTETKRIMNKSQSAFVLKKPREIDTIISSRSRDGGQKSYRKKLFSQFSQIEYEDISEFENDLEPLNNNKDLNINKSNNNNNNNDFYYSNKNFSNKKISSPDTDSDDLADSKLEPRVNISNTTTLNEIPGSGTEPIQKSSLLQQKSKDNLNVTPMHQASKTTSESNAGANVSTQPVSSNTSTPNRTIGFKFTKTKRDSNSTNSNSNPNSQYPSASSTPRKKLEKLNYKSGIDILEIYKSKYSNKLLNNDVNQIILENNYATFSVPASTSNINQSNEKYDNLLQQSSILLTKNGLKTDEIITLESTSKFSPLPVINDTKLNEHKENLESMSKLQDRKIKKTPTDLDIQDIQEEPSTIETIKKGIKEKLIKLDNKSSGPAEEEIELVPSTSLSKKETKKSIKKKKIVFV